MGQQSLKLYNVLIYRKQLKWDVNKLTIGIKCLIYVSLDKLVVLNSILNLNITYNCKMYGYFIDIMSGYLEKYTLKRN